MSAAVIQNSTLYLKFNILYNPKLFLYSIFKVLVYVIENVLSISTFYFLFNNQLLPYSIFKFLSSFQLFLQHSRHRQAKLFELVGLLSKKNFPPDGQTRWAKSTSQQVNLLSARPSMIPSHPGKIITLRLWCGFKC